MEDVPGVRWEALVETSGRLGAGALREGVPRRDHLGVLTWSGPRRRLDVPTARRILPAAVRGHDLVVLDLARQGGADLALFALHTRATRTHAATAGEYDAPALPVRHGPRV